MKTTKKRQALKIVILSLVFFTFLSCLLTVSAQQGAIPTYPHGDVKEDYSDDELRQFISANEEASKVQLKGEQQMITAIEEENLSIERFNEILMVQQGQMEETDASEEEMASFNKAIQKVMEIQQGMQGDIVKAIEGAGMDLNKYQEMMHSYQQSLKVQEKVNKLLEE